MPWLRSESFFVFTGFGIIIIEFTEASQQPIITKTDEITLTLPASLIDYRQTPSRRARPYPMVRPLDLLSSALSSVYQSIAKS